jgi:hypothetical protein
MERDETDVSRQDFLSIDRTEKFPIIPNAKLNIYHSRCLMNIFQAFDRKRTSSYNRYHLTFLHTYLLFSNKMRPTSD